MTARGIVLFLALLFAPPVADEPVRVRAFAEGVVGPRAYLTGPLTAAVGSDIHLVPTGSVGQRLRIKVSRGPEQAKVLPEFTNTGGWAKNGEWVLLGGVCTPSKPGNYEFVLIASNDAVPPGTEPQEEFGFWTVAVGDVPPPVPTPTPGPGPIPPPSPVPPVPPPQPAPGPVPATTELVAVAVFSGDTTSADELAFTAVRDDPSLKSQLEALKVQWHPMDRADPRLVSSGITPFLTDPAVGPTILIFDTARNLYDATGRVVPRPAAKSFKAPLTSAEMLSLFKRLRGVN